MTLTATQPKSNDHFHEDQIDGASKLFSFRFSAARARCAPRTTTVGNHNLDSLSTAYSKTWRVFVPLERLKRENLHAARSKHEMVSRAAARPLCV